MLSVVSKITGTPAKTVAATEKKTDWTFGCLRLRRAPCSPKTMPGGPHRGGGGVGGGGLAVVSVG